MGIEIGSSALPTADRSVVRAILPSSRNQNDQSLSDQYTPRTRAHKHSSGRKAAHALMHFPLLSNCSEDDLIAPNADMPMLPMGVKLQMA